MGAHSVSFEFSGRLTKDQVSTKFHQMQEKEDRKLKRIAKIDPDIVEGYYSDLGYIKFEDKLFEDEHEAYMYCIDRAQRWEYCYAVKTKTLKPGAKKRTTIWLVVGWMSE